MWILDKKRRMWININIFKRHRNQVFVYITWIVQMYVECDPLLETNNWDLRLEMLLLLRNINQRVRLNTRIKRFDVH